MALDILSALLGFGVGFVVTFFIALCETTWVRADEYFIEDVGGENVLIHKGPKTVTINQAGKQNVEVRPAHFTNSSNRLSTSKVSKHVTLREAVVERTKDGGTVESVHYAFHFQIVDIKKLMRQSIEMAQKSLEVELLEHIKKLMRSQPAAFFSKIRRSSLHISAVRVMAGTGEDEKTFDAFKETFGVEISDVEFYIHQVTNPDRVDTKAEFKSMIEQGMTPDQIRAYAALVAARRGVSLPVAVESKTN